MQVRIRYGRQELEVAVEPDQRFSHHRGPDPLPNTVAAVRHALDAPFAFVPLSQAMTPDDRVALVVDESIADIANVVGPVSDYLTALGVQEVARVTVRDHHPTDPTNLAYLASTTAGRRVYLNKAIVDADQVIVISARRYESGTIAGAEAALYPALGDEAARDATPEESREAGWLLGLPFHVQIIEAAGEGIAHVIAGTADAAREAERLLALSWRLTLPRRVDTVIATLTGDHSFSELARAAGVAADIIQPGGRIVLLSGGDALPGPEFDRLRGAESPDGVSLEGAARDWARAAAHARISVLSGHDSALLEELFASGLAGPEMVQRLIARSGDCAVVEDAARFAARVE